jgi:predicted dehydrogenase
MTHMADKLRVGVIGTSWWADWTHLPLMRHEPRVDLSAICGRNHARAQEMANKYAISEVYTDYHEMFAKGRLDAVVICTPDDEHMPMTMAALDAGLHVLCEKPLAMNAADAKAMLDKAEAKGLRHMVFFTWRWQPHYRYMRELIDQGVIGRLYHAELSFLMGNGRNVQYQWRFDPARGNGVTGDSGAHIFDLARYLVGDVAAVSANVQAHVARMGKDGNSMKAAGDVAHVMLQFANGAQGSMTMSSLARVDDPFLVQTVALYGEAGSLVSSLRLVAGPEVKLARGDGPFEIMHLPEAYLAGIDLAQPYVASAIPMFLTQPIGSRLFIDSICDKHTYAPSFYEGRKAQQLIDACIESSLRRRWVDITEAGAS